MKRLKRTLGINALLANHNAVYRPPVAKDATRWILHLSILAQRCRRACWRSIQGLADISRSDRLACMLAGLIR